MCVCASKDKVSGNFSLIESAVLYLLLVSMVSIFQVVYMNQDYSDPYSIHALPSF